MGNPDSRSFHELILVVHCAEGGSIKKKVFVNELDAPHSLMLLLLNMDAWPWGSFVTGLNIRKDVVTMRRVLEIPRHVSTHCT